MYMKIGALHNMQTHAELKLSDYTWKIRDHPQWKLMSVFEMAINSVHRATKSNIFPFWCIAPFNIFISIEMVFLKRAVKHFSWCI